MIIIIAAVGFVILSIGGGIGYWIWIASRPKKMTWKCYIYQMSEGIIDQTKLRGGIRIDYKLSDLRPYTTDVIQKIDRKDGSTHYWLTKLKKPTPPVTTDCVETWAPNNKFVRVLLDGDTCTLLKSGYDRKIGGLIFRPLPVDRINMIKTELAERKERIENTKDILAQITPFIVVGIAMLALVVIAYFEVQGAIKIAEINDKITTDNLEAQERLADKYLQAMTGKSYLPDEIEKEEPPPTIPP